MKKELNRGIYPTMITPYKRNGAIDFDMVRRLADWYIDKGCSGIFAVCQSSEMVYLSLKERVALAEAVVKQVDGRISVVASGHCGNSMEEQVTEMNEMSKTGIDAFVLVSNRFDRHHDGDEVFIDNMERLLDKANKDIDLGIYECPVPYKRLISPTILEWIKSNSRFRFIKDTCCDPDMLKYRCEALAGTDCMLFNANEQTALYSFQNGASGYSGIMANFHPELLVWLFENYRTDAQKAEQLSDMLSMSAFTEGPSYPCTAKYYLGIEGLSMETLSRSADEKSLTSYQKYVTNQLYNFNNTLRRIFLKEEK